MRILSLGRRNAGFPRMFCVCGKVLMCEVLYCVYLKNYAEKLIIWMIPK